MKITVEIPNYIRQVKLSEARNRKYYEKGKKAPKAKKYEDTTKYGWKKYGTKEFLIDLETDERVVANPRAAGTPRYITINGQKIYNGEASKHIRNKVLSTIKESFAPYINKLDTIDTEKFPLNIHLEVHDIIREPSSNSLWDLDNRAWPYIKAFQDCLTGNVDKKGKKRNKVIIPDDNILFVTQPPVPKFIPVDREEDRKLVFTIVEEKDKRILKHKEFSKQLKEELDEVTRISKGGEQNLEKGRRTQRVSPLQARSNGRGR